ncbi:unnamed protein product, partial [Prorocentrum cordatum]
PRRAAAHGSLLGKGSLGLVLFCQPEARRGADPLTAAAARAVSSREEEEADRRERERERERNALQAWTRLARQEKKRTVGENRRPRGRGEAHSWSSPAARAGRAGRGAVRPASRRRPLRRPAASRERREAEEARRRRDVRSWRRLLWRPEADQTRPGHPRWPPRSTKTGGEAPPRALVGRQASQTDPVPLDPSARGR